MKAVIAVAAFALAASVAQSQDEPRAGRDDPESAGFGSAGGGKVETCPRRGRFESDAGQPADPDTTGGKAKNGQGHLVYRVDDGPSIVTTATKLEFRDLPHGNHRIVIELVANDGTPIGPYQVLDVAIP